MSAHFILIFQTATLFSIGNLHEATGYIVRIQALSQAGSGQVATIFFTTPMLQTPIKGNELIEFFIRQFVLYFQV